MTHFQALLMPELASKVFPEEYFENQCLKGNNITNPCIFYTLSTVLLLITHGLLLTKHIILICCHWFFCFVLSNSEQLGYFSRIDFK